MLISETLLAKERGDDSRWDWSALPVFLSRGHFCLGVLVNTTSGIEHLGDLKGKRIGVPDYHMTAALWMRCAMKDLYGIEASDNVWYDGRTKDFSHGGPPGVTHYWLEADQYLDQMLDLGELDAAVFSPGTGLAPGHTVSMDRYGGTPLTGNPRIRPLLDDGGRAVVAEFYRKTGAFMANHHVIVQNRILKDNPWAAMALFKAFQESKELAYQDARRQRSTYLYFQGNDEQDHAAIFGEDTYPLGLKAMRPEDIYYPSTLDT
jgi:4,5-dihydroxyphthalate decarboxylase